jgi:hypothetical protein
MEMKIEDRIDALKLRHKEQMQKTLTEGDNFVKDEMHRSDYTLQIVSCDGFYFVVLDHNIVKKKLSICNDASEIIHHYNHFKKAIEGFIANL